MNRRGVTLVELCVVIVIILTLAAMLIPAVMAARSNQSVSATEPRDAPESRLLHTVRHDGHTWVIGWSLDGGSHASAISHHPDCPCRKQTAEAE